MAFDGEPFANLKALGSDRMSEIDEMLRGGMSPAAVGKVIQTEWGEMTSSKPETLKKQLDRYRAKVIRAQIIETTNALVKKIPTTVLAKKLNVLEEMTELVSVQKRRFYKALNQEDLMPKLLMKNVTEEAKVLKDMLVELGKLQLETGALQRAPKKLTASVVDPDGSIRSFEWTEAQEALSREIDGYTVIDHETVDALEDRRSQKAA